MTTAAQTSARNTNARGVPGGNVDEVMKAGEKPTRAQPPKARLTATDTKVYVKALTAAEGFHKKAFYVEIATALVFFNHVGIDKEAKLLLREKVYAPAGYDCKDTKGEDYKTVVRRIAKSADLMVYLSEKEQITVADWEDDAKLADAIQAVAGKLEKRGFDSIDAIRKVTEPEVVNKEAQKRKTNAAAAKKASADKANAKVQEGPKEGQKEGTPQPQVTMAGATQGLPTGQPEGQEPSADMKAMLKEAAANGEPQPQATHDRRSTDKLPANRVLETAHMRVYVPEEATQKEVMQMATLLMTFAQTMPVTAAVPVGAPVAA